MIEITPPDLSIYKQGNTGIDYIHHFDSGHKGPHAVITSLVHGNEYSGAIAMKHILDVGLIPKKGKLTLIFVNIQAFKQFNKQSPYYSRYYHEDFNRLWDQATIDAYQDTIEKKRLHEIKPFIDQADYLLDLHSMSDYSPPLCLTGPSEKGLDFARKMNLPAIVVADCGHASGKRLRDYDRFNDPQTSAVSLLVECGQHWETAAIDMATYSCYRFLSVTGVLSLPERLFHQQNFNDTEGYLNKKNQIQNLYLNVSHTITVQNNTFFFKKFHKSLDVIAEKGTLIGCDGEEKIYTPFDQCYLIMPQQGARQGQTAVRLAHEIR